MVRHSSRDFSRYRYQTTFVQLACRNSALTYGEALTTPLVGTPSLPSNCILDGEEQQKGQEHGLFFSASLEKDAQYIDSAWGKPITASE
jgi:hypothetical protein